MDKENAATNVRRRSGSSASGRSKSASARRKTQTRRKTSGTRRKTSRGSDIAAVIARLPKPVLAGAVALIVLIIIIVFAAKGCGVSHKAQDRQLQHHSGADAGVHGRAQCGQDRHLCRLLLRGRDRCLYYLCRLLLH